MRSILDKLSCAASQEHKDSRQGDIKLSYKEEELWLKCRPFILDGLFFFFPRWSFHNLKLQRISLNKRGYH